MVFMPGPLFAAVERCTGEKKAAGTQVVFFTPQGKPWSQEMALEFSTIPHTILICGRYEGVDQRIVDCLVDREVSIGDFVLTGGEIPAMVILDSVIRLIPGALGKRESALNESFSTGLLDFPQYTRPHSFRGQVVPEVLLSGNHARIQKWRKEKALERTIRSRPDMIKKSGI
jgi:tRNA (guanine37-N1)-methyltransferase